MKYIHVTQEDIDQGKPVNTRECPVALATSRKIGRKAFATFDQNPKSGKIFATIGVEPRVTEWRISDKVYKLMVKFDYGEAIRPFRFKMPDEMRRDLGL